MKRADVQEVLSGDPWKLKRAARELDVSQMTVWRWINRGVARKSDGQRVYLGAIQGPGGLLTSRAEHVRFVGELNATNEESRPQ